MEPSKSITRAPLSRLPPELLALIFERLNKKERTLCVMSCWSWRVLIKGLWPMLKTNPNYMMYEGAENGSLPLMRFAKKWGATEFDCSLWCAALEGHIDCMKLAKEWGATKFNNHLWCVALEGHIDCMKLLKKWGATNFDRALAACASERDNIEVMKLLLEWGATNFDDALWSATFNNHLNYVKLLEEWIREQNDGSFEAWKPVG